jgi:hypothetical protein
LLPLEEAPTDTCTVWLPNAPVASQARTTSWCVPLAAVMLALMLEAAGPV